MRNTLNPCRRWFLAVAVLFFCLGEAQAGLVGETLSGTGREAQAQNAGRARTKTLEQWRDLLPGRAIRPADAEDKKD